MDAVDGIRTNIVSSFSNAIETIVKNRFEMTFPDEKHNGHRKSKSKSYYGTGYARRGGMSDEILREANGSSLTMALIGCLPDNVQQAVKGFSIRPGKQHITFSFPFMMELIKRFKPEACVTEASMLHQQHVTPALLFDQSIEVIDGYQTYVTYSPVHDRPCMPVSLFTLYQRDTTEGLVKHFESLVRILLDNKTLLTVWKMPLCVVDLSPQSLQLIVDACAQAIVDIQTENLLNTFPEKTKDELLMFVKEKMVVPNIVSYQEYFQLHVKEVISRMQTVDPERFLAVVDHLRSIRCTAIDFQKADIMMKNPTTDPLIKSFWHIWGQDQVACKMFPIVMASHAVNRAGVMALGLRTTNIHEVTVRAFHHVPIKEGIQSIIKCLKAQDMNLQNPSERPDKMKSCSCHVCKVMPPRYADVHKPPYWGRRDPDSFQTQSAFYRPRPTMKSRLHFTSTPYSDALKAAAISPGRTHVPLHGADAVHTLRSEFRRTYLSATVPCPPYVMQPLPHKVPPPGSAVYPIVYKPRIITQNVTCSTHE